LSGSEDTGLVPLPNRVRPSSNKGETAVAIRDGRRAIQRLAVLDRVLKASSTSGRSISGTSSNRYSARRTSCLSTVLEQDFTVPGKKSSLSCPYAAQSKVINPAEQPPVSQSGSTMDSDRPLTPSDSKDPTPHHSTDPICAAMYAETMNSPPPSVTGSAAKCPIRYLNQHSPEEVAQYFESHKHEIPRSHEVCVKRYQRNETDIRKLDAKYGNLVSMIQGLGVKHQPMLPPNEEGDEMEADDHMSNERVENWAHAVSTDGAEEDAASVPAEDDDREGRFDRPFKEIRVGESPSRPWGISVPVFDPPTERERAYSPPPAPVSAEHLPKPAGKCPFGFDQKSKTEEPPCHRSPTFERGTSAADRRPLKEENNAKEALDQEALADAKPSTTQPIFVLPETVKSGSGVPQMVFTGPVFIGYPVEQAVELMQQWKMTK